MHAAFGDHREIVDQILIAKGAAIDVHHAIMMMLILRNIFLSFKRQTVVQKIVKCYTE